MRATSPNRITHGRTETWQTDGVLLEPAALTERIDFARMFGNTRPVEIEIGSGKGTFLLARAGARPEVNFIGIEYVSSYCAYTADRVRRSGLTNVRMLPGDAAPFFRTCVPDASLLRLHVYFPDPWPKRKHHRRRLIQPPFVAEARRTLIIGGQLIIVTDHLDYFQQIRTVLEHAEGFARIPFPRMSPREGELVGTNFERKYIAQGRPFYHTTRLRYR